MKVLVALALLFSCEEDEVTGMLEDERRREHAAKYLRARELIVDVDDRRLVFGGFSAYSARRQYAMGGKLRISVEQYFYIKKRLKLLYADLPCIYVERGAHKDFYPLEALSI